MGYWRDTDDGDQQFIVLPELFNREICKGHDSKVALKALLASGAMVANSKGSATHAQRIDKASKPVSVYIISANGLGLPVRPKDRYTLDHAATAAANEPANRAVDIASAETAGQTQARMAPPQATASDPTYFAQKPLPLKKHPTAPRKTDSPTTASLQAQRPLESPDYPFVQFNRPDPVKGRRTCEPECEPEQEFKEQERMRPPPVDKAAAEAANTDAIDEATRAEMLRDAAAAEAAYAGCL